MMSCNENETSRRVARVQGDLRYAMFDMEGCWFLSERNCRMQLRKVVMTLD